MGKEEKEEEKKEHFFLNLLKKILGSKAGRNAILIIVVALGVFYCVCYFIPQKFMGVPNIFTSREGKVTVVSESQLKEALEINEFSTLEASYNSIAKIYGEDGKYYVAYEGTVRMGFDPEKLDYAIDDKGKKIKVILPEIEVQDVVVDQKSLDFIDVDEDETIIAKSYERCKQDLDSKVRRDQALKDIARENAENFICASLQPYEEKENFKIIIE